MQTAGAGDKGCIITCRPVCAQPAEARPLAGRKDHRPSPVPPRPSIQFWGLLLLLMPPAPTACVCSKRKNTQKLLLLFLLLPLEPFPPLHRVCTSCHHLLGHACDTCRRRCSDCLGRSNAAVGLLPRRRSSSTGCRSGSASQRTAADYPWGERQGPSFNARVVKRSRFRMVTQHDEPAAASTASLSSSQYVWLRVSQLCYGMSQALSLRKLADMVQARAGAGGCGGGGRGSTSAQVWCRGLTGRVLPKLWRAGDHEPLTAAGLAAWHLVRRQGPRQRGGGAVSAGKLCAAKGGRLANPGGGLPRVSPSGAAYPACRRWRDCWRTSSRASA